MNHSTQQTQLDKIKADLLNGCQVDSVTAFSKGITRLAAIIKRLRERGWPVITDQDKGNGISRYRFPANWTAGGDIEQSAPKCCNKCPSELTS